MNGPAVLVSLLKSSEDAKWPPRRWLSSARHSQTRCRRDAWEEAGQQRMRTLARSNAAGKMTNVEIPACLRTLFSFPLPSFSPQEQKKQKHHSEPFNRIRLVGLRTTCPSRERTAARRAGRAGDPESVKERGRAASGPGRRQPCPPLPPRCVCGCGASFPPPRCLSPTQDERLEGEHGRCVRASLPVL